MSFPLRLGTPEDFAAARQFFQQAAFFDDVALCKTLKVGDMSDVGRVDWDKFDFGKLPKDLVWCINFFLRGLPISEAESNDRCGTGAIRAFQNLGLVEPGTKNPQNLVCPAWVYPVDGFVVASDRRDHPEGDSFAPPEDVVFPAIYGGTLRFLRLLPTPKGDALDLCGGSGIGALRFSRSARRSVTADVAERAAQYAEFNARLNGVRMESLCGDLYGPVIGSQFDLITAHPPFVPAVGQNMVYRDGGDTGEEITRRTIEGLPAHLRPGGACVILCVARDTQEGPFEERARQWLGQAGSEFDIVFGLEKVLSVEEVVDSMRKRAEGFNETQAQQLLQRLLSFGTKQFVYGALFLRREGSTVPQPPLRLRMTPEGVANDFEAVLEWRRRSRQPGFETSFAHLRPTPAPKLELNVRHIVHEGELVPAEFVFSIEAGFQYALRPDGWVVPLIARFDGKQSVEEVFTAGRLNGAMPEGFQLNDFAGLVRTMIERGLLEVEREGAS